MQREPEASIRCPPTVGQRGHSLQIHQVHQRVGGRLDPHSLGAIGQHPFCGYGIPKIHIHSLDPLAA